MIRSVSFLLAGLLLACKMDAQVHSQLFSGRQEMFLEAETFHLFGQYNEALPLYISLLEYEPDNAFLNYRTGTTYLHIPGNKDNTIYYLEKAIVDMDSRDRRPTFRTTKAPLDALFYLGQAYHINYQFDKAIEMYTRFRNKLNPSVYNLEIVDEHIQSSLNAIESIQNPVFYVEENLGNRINTRFSETNPVVSGNKQVLAFSRRLPFYDGIFVSRKESDCAWSWPVEITSDIGSDGDCYPVSLSFDGKELYLFKSDDLVGNIYVSRFEGEEWSTAKKLNQNINTAYWESHASVTADGEILYFTSNRPGGFGDLDIYYSKRDKNGEWGPAVNLGAKINTPYNEETPFISEDGNTLHFSSYGHYNMGGYDVLYSVKDDQGNWTKPVNAGYGINTPHDDLFFHPVRNGIYAYVSKLSDNEAGVADIFRYEFFSEKNPRIFNLRGIMKRGDGLQTGLNARARIVEEETGELVKSVRPNQITGEFNMNLRHGNWMLQLSEEGHEPANIDLILPPDRREPLSELVVVLNIKEPEIPGLYDIVIDRMIIPEIAKPETTAIPEKVETVAEIIDQAAEHAHTETITPKRRDAVEDTFEYPLPEKTISGENGMPERKRNITLPVMAIIFTGLILFILWRRRKKEEK